ncbi:MAG: hypothetical protein MRY21_01390 [Simkaniaceae bacterium]|nr:hypothetical protein [Simkaniaceae bacterium]
MKSDFLEIETYYHHPDEGAEGFNLFKHAVQKQIEILLPDALREIEDEELFYKEMQKQMPILSWSASSKEPYAVRFSCMCPSAYTHGVGRFLADMCSRWFIPGKQLPLVSVNTMAFNFKKAPWLQCLALELIAPIGSKKDLAIVKSSIEDFMREMRLIIMVVQHARSIVSSKPLTLPQKKLLIEENISTLIDRPSTELDLSSFDQMHHFLIKVMGEQKMSKIQENMAPLQEAKPQIFDRDIFNELQLYLGLFKDRFVALRDMKHLIRIISYKYLFRKTIQNAQAHMPTQRHMSVKIVPTKLETTGASRPILGVIVGMNLIKENELFEERHVMRALMNLLEDIELVQDSVILDRRAPSQVRTLYLEIAKIDGKPFSASERRRVKLELSTQLKTSVESAINPIFMPKNEEEVMRNIVTLSNQLKYASDIPQVIINFQKQSESHISFTIVLLRLIKRDALRFKELLSKRKSPYLIDKIDSKIVGQLRKRFPKEANVFELHLKKQDFLRSDFSLDLFEARREVFQTLTNLVGELRDYNGGMISKQAEVFNILTKLLDKRQKTNDFLLKTFFYSITPSYMQSLLDPKLLKILFQMVTKTVHHDYNHAPHRIEMKREKGYFFCTLGCINPALRNHIIERVETLDFYENDLTSCSLHTYDIAMLSYLIKEGDSFEDKRLEETIQLGINEWEGKINVELSRSHTL